MISNFRRVTNVVCFLLGDFPASEFYMPTFRNTVPSSKADTHPPIKMEQYSETSVYKIQTPGNYPEESIQHVVSRLLNKILHYVRKLLRCSVTIFMKGITNRACRFHTVRILITVPSYSVTWSSKVKLLSVALEFSI